MSRNNRTTAHNNNVVGQVDFKKTGPTEWLKEQRVIEQVYTTTNLNSSATILTGLGSAGLNVHKYRSAITLLDGRTMIFGGNSTVTRFYNPITNITSTAARANPGPRVRSAVLLNDGQVYMLPHYAPASAESAWTQAYLYNPSNDTYATSSGTFDDIKSGDAPESSSATSFTRRGILLPSGEVFVTSPTSSGGREVELYNPITDTLTSVPGGPTGRWSPTLLPDGRVYMFPVGGTQIAQQSAIIFNPINKTFISASTDLPPRALTISSFYSEAITIPDGRVFISPADGGTGSYYDPRTDTFSTAVTFTFSPAALFSRNVVLLRDGRVYIVPCNGPNNPGRVFDPSTNVLSTPVNFDNANGSAAVVMIDGRVNLPPAGATVWRVLGDVIPNNQRVPPERLYSIYSGNRHSTG